MPLVWILETIASLHCIKSAACFINREERRVMIFITPIVFDNLLMFLTCSLIHSKETSTRDYYCYYYSSFPISICYMN